MVLRAQWEKLSRSMTKAGPDFDCMRLYKPAAPVIQEMVQKYIYSMGKCNKFGCVKLPITINQTRIGGQYICDPVAFDEKLVNMQA